MADRVVFLVHGMGVHEADWATPWVAALRTHFDAYPDTLLTRRSFEQRFAFVPVTFDDVLAALLQRWHDEGFALDLAMQQFGGEPDVLRAIENVLQAAGQDEFFWTHAADVLLYRGSSLVREGIKAHVAAQIAAKLQELAGAEGILPDWSVVAHSLGTIVVHDALDALWTAQISGVGNRFDPRNPGAQATLVMMVANVSRLLQTQPQAYVSTVMPGGPGAAVPGQANRFCGCRHYLSVRHALDPFTIPGRFRPEPPDWPDSATQAGNPKPFLEIAVDHIHDPNVHAFEHYLAHPAVHIALFRRLIHRMAIGQDKEQVALEGFRATDGLSPAAAIEIKTRLERIIPAADELWPILRLVSDAYRAHLATPT